LLRHEDEDKI